MEFAPLHGHSTFSFLEAIGTPKKIIKKAKELWIQNIAITDLWWIYGAISFYENALENNINPIIGVELWFVLDISGYNKIEDIGNICLLAKNDEWYVNLMKIVSYANKDWISWKPKIDPKILGKHGKWIIAFMWGDQSWIGKMILRSEWEDKILEIISILQDKLWKNNVFLEIIAQDESKDEKIKKINKKILKIADDKFDIIVNNIYMYVDKTEKDAREMALAIKDAKKIYDQDRRQPSWDFYLMDGEEIFGILSKNKYSDEQIQTWMGKNNEIANSIKVKIEMWQTLFPNYDSKPDIIQKYDKIKNDLISE